MKDFTYKSDIEDNLVAKSSVLNDFEFTEAMAFDQSYEGVPGGNVLFGGMQIKKKKYDDNTTGAWVGVDNDGLAKMYLGNTTNYLKYDGSDIELKGIINLTNYVLTPAFESVDGWTKNLGTSGAICPYLGSVILSTGANQSLVSMHAETLSGTPGTIEGGNVDFTKNVSMSFVAQVDWGGSGGDTNAVFYLACGLVGDSACGFKITGGKLYSYHEATGPSEVLTELTGVTLFNVDPYWNKYEVKTSYASPLLTMKFYVNDVLKDTRATNYFASSPSSMYFKIIDAVANNKVMRISKLIFYQEL